MIIREMPDQAPAVPMENPMDSYRVLQGVWRAEVISVTNGHPSVIPGTKKEIILQDVRVRLLEGDRKGTEVLIENDFREMKAGDKVLVNYFVNNTVELYSVNERERRPLLAIVVSLFVLAVVALGRWRGVRSLLGLIAAFLLIGLVLVPALLYGFPALVTSIVVAIAISFCIIYINHGFNRHSNAAFLGAAGSALVAGALSWAMVSLSQVTGFGSDEALFLNYNLPAKIDFIGLILGGIIIGALGVLTSIAVSQVSVVRELVNVHPGLNSRQLFVQGLKSGSDQVGALIHALALAYIGASLPLLLLFSLNKYGLSVVVNQEVFTIEIIRTVSGSLGLIAAIPLTTFIAIKFFKNK
jgi:uncharacterized membrane protein